MRIEIMVNEEKESNELITYINNNMSKKDLISLYSKLRYKPQYNHYNRNCPEKMWQEKPLLNCDDEDRIEEIFDKMVEEGLKACPLIILERDIKDGIPVHHENYYPNHLHAWIVANNARELWHSKPVELDMLQKRKGGIEKMDTNDLTLLIDMVAVTLSDIREIIKHKKDILYRKDLMEVKPFHIMMEIPYVDEKGVIQTDNLNQVDSIELECDETSCKLIVYYFDGMPERKEYLYEDIQRNLLYNVRFMIDVTDVLQEVSFNQLPGKEM